MKINAYKLNAFTKNINGGNPAGVVINAEQLNEKHMQQLAAIIGFSETAFVSESNIADFKLRFFTPAAEVDLCGHATIAAFSLLLQRGFLQEGEYTQETKAGILKLRVEDNVIYMQQALPQFFEIVDGEELIGALGIDKKDFENKLPIQAVSTGIKDIFIPVKDENVLRNLKPDMHKIEVISKKYNAIGLHVFTLAKNSYKSAICRNFAPLYGIPEESATGTSNGALACYLYKYNVFEQYNKEIVFEQGLYMNKPSEIRARLIIDNHILKEIWVGGEAVFLGESIYQI